MNVLRIFIIFFATIFLLGSGLTLFLTILTGATQTSVLRKFYWLETDCSNFSGSPVSSTCRWTNYGLCGVQDNRNTDCTHDVAAYPFSPSRNFNSNDNLPSAFVDNANYYYYTSRIGYGFSLVGLAFLVFSWFPFLILLFTKVGFAALQSVFWVLYGLALLFVIIGIALSTSAYAKGRNHFRNAGFTANLGTKAMATAWTTVFLLLFSIPFIVFASREWSLGSLGRKRRGYNSGVNEETNNNSKSGRFSFRNRSKSAYGSSSSNGGGFRRKDIPPSNQMVANPEVQQSNQPYNEVSGNPNNVVGADGTTNANYLSFTPVKEVKAGTVAMENTDADRNLYP